VDVVAQFHRFLGESLVTISVIVTILAFLAAQGSSGLGRGATIAGRILLGLLDLQWLLGVINYFGLPAAVRPSLAHPLLMTAVVVGVHVAAARARKGPGLGRWGLAGVYAAAAVLIIVGIRLA